MKTSWGVAVATYCWEVVKALCSHRHTVLKTNKKKEINGRVALLATGTCDYIYVICHRWLLWCYLPHVHKILFHMWHHTKIVIHHMLQNIWHPYSDVYFKSF